MRVAVFAPIQNGLYSRVLTHLVHNEPGLEMACVIVRTPWDLKRIKGEIKRDGARLVRKVYQKLVLGEKGFDPGSTDHLKAYAQRVQMPGKNLTELCNTHGIKLVSTRDHNSPEVQKALKETGAEIVAFTGGGLIRQHILDATRLGVLNCHMGILPPYRGMDVVEYPVLEGATDDPGLGITTHFMAKGVDTGDILLKRRFDLVPDDSYQKMRIRVGPIMVDLMLETLRGLRDQTLEPKPQDERDGKQYYVLHPRIYEKAVRDLAKIAPSG